MAKQDAGETKRRQAETAPSSKAGKKAAKGGKAKTPNQAPKRPKKRERKPSPDEREKSADRKGSDAAGGKRAADVEKKPRKPMSVAQVVGRILPVLCLALAFVAIVALYRKLMPQTVDETTAQSTTAPSEQVLVSSSNPDSYAGLEDKWLASGLFTTGNKELDAQVRDFCDALTVEGSSARDNANSVFNTIVWSQYEERGPNEQPSGTEWTIASARHYFSTASPADGQPGSGDVYDFAAAISFCLRYFGFYDAYAIPIVKGTLATGQTNSALVVVSDEEGRPCVCDPTLAAEGFMLDRGLYTIVVDNIGQDLTTVEALGLDVRQPQELGGGTSGGNGATGAGANGGASANTSGGTSDNAGGGASENAGVGTGTDSGFGESSSAGSSQGADAYEGTTSTMSQTEYGQTYN